MALRVLNPNAEVLNKSAALYMNINAAKGLQDVLKTNLGPKGTIKMYVLVCICHLCLFFCSHLYSKQSMHLVAQSIDRVQQSIDRVQWGFLFIYFSSKVSMGVLLACQ